MSDLRKIPVFIYYIYSLIYRPQKHEITFCRVIKAVWLWWSLWSNAKWHYETNLETYVSKNVERETKKKGYNNSYWAKRGIYSVILG